MASSASRPPSRYRRTQSRTVVYGIPNFPDTCAVATPWSTTIEAADTITSLGQPQRAFRLLIPFDPSASRLELVFTSQAPFRHQRLARSEVKC
jgi:hypothetical protein